MFDGSDAFGILFDFRICGRNTGGSTYANPADNIGLEKDQALDFANLVLAQPNPESFLKKYKAAMISAWQDVIQEGRIYANDKTNLNLEKRGAMNFAFEIALRNDGPEVGSRFLEAFKYAYKYQFVEARTYANSDVNLGLEKDQALEFAIQNSGMSATLQQLLAK